MKNFIASFLELIVNVIWPQEHATESVIINTKQYTFFKFSFRWSYMFDVTGDSPVRNTMDFVRRKLRRA